MLRTCLAAALLLLAATATVHAQSPLTANTLKRDSTAVRATATLAEMSWLAGHWRGPSLGGVSEEIWAAPLGGSMMGSYRLVRGDSVIFYEILALTEQDSTLVLRLKHFNRDLTGWEEKGEVVSFPLVRMTPAAAYFEGMTMRRIDDDRIQVFVAMRTRDGMVEAEFPYTRVDPALVSAGGPRR